MIWLFVAQIAAGVEECATDEAVASLREASGGWRGDASPEELLVNLNAGLCDFAVEEELSTEAFEAKYRGKEPVLVRGAFTARDPWTKAALRARPGSAQYGAGSDVVYAGGGSTNHATLRSLVDKVETGDPDDVFAFDTTALDAADVQQPSFLDKFGAEAWPILSLGPSRSGLPMHAHGETWLGLAHGAKRYFAAPPGGGIDPDVRKEIHPLASARQWYEAVIVERNQSMLSCLQRASDVVYLPAGWKHATLNVGDAVAVGRQDAYRAEERYDRMLHALRESPRDIEALHGAGVAAAHLAFEGVGEVFYEQALVFLHRAIDESPLQPEVSIILAEVFDAEGRTDEAFEAMVRIRDAYLAGRDAGLAGAPNNFALAAVHLKFARFFLGVESWIEAIPSLDHALELRPDYAAALKDRALAHAKLNNPTDALHDIDRALAIDPDDPDLPRHRAALLGENVPPATTTKRRRKKKLKKKKSKTINAEG